MLPLKKEEWPQTKMFSYGMFSYGKKINSRGAEFTYIKVTYMDKE